MAVSDGVTTRRVEIRFHSGPPSNTPGAGLVRFTPIAEYVPMAETATVDPYILLNHEFTAPLVDGVVSTEVTVTDNPLMGVRDWSWVATPELVDGQGASISGPPPFPFVVPAGEGTLNLVPFADVPASPGLGQAQIISYAIRAAEYADAAAASAASAAAGLSGSTAAAETAGQAAVKAAASAAASEGSAAAARESAAAAQQQAGTASAAATGAQAAATSAAGMVARAESAATASGSDAAKARQAADAASAASTTASTAASTAASVAAAVKARADAGEFMGAKGDPGGWNAGTLLLTANLDTITTPGLYRTSGPDDVSAARNYPSVYVGTLQVEARISAGQPYGPSVTQVFTPFLGVPAAESRLFYKRTLTGSAWQPWRVFTSQRVSNTAGRAIYAWDDTANREQLIYGDTGIRNITDFIDTSKWTVSVAKLRRYGATVELRLQLSPVAGATGQVPIFKTETPIPAGFRNQHTIQGAAVLGGASLKVFRIEFLGTQAVILDVSGASAFGILASWQTTDAWPTTLPGIADGTIPNA